MRLAWVRAAAARFAFHFRGATPLALRVALMTAVIDSAVSCAGDVLLPGLIATLQAESGPATTTITKARRAGISIKTSLMGRMRLLSGLVIDSKQVRQDGEIVGNRLSVLEMEGGRGGRVCRGV